MLGRLSVLMSVIALAFACFPVLARAECTSSSCVQYTESIPQAEGGNPSTHHQTPAHVSKTGGSGGSGPTHSGTGGSGETGTGENGSSPKQGSGGTDHNAGTPQGKAGGSANGQQNASPHQGSRQASPLHTSKSSEGGGSSPLVPILIAIAVLAAISVAAVMIRQRRQRRGPSATASPEAN
jgi:hypothetical protein